MEFKTYISSEEMDEYLSLYERLYALNTLKAIIKNKEIMDKVLQDSKRTLINIKKWWNKIDEKYILIHAENSFFEINPDENLISLIINSEQNN